MYYCRGLNVPKMWNDMPANIKLCKSMFNVKKLYFCNLINLVNVFVLLVCNDNLIYVM